MTIGPKEIYNYQSATNQITAVIEFCQKDRPESVEKFKTHYQSEHDGEFLNGYEVRKNIFIMAAQCTNVNLVKFIVENADPQILNMRDSEGYTALHNLVKYGSSTPIEKIIACAEMIIQAGADINARDTYEKYSLTNLPPPEIALDEHNFKGENALGCLVRQISDPHASNDANETKKYESLIRLFLDHGATKCYSFTDSSNVVCYDIDEKDTGVQANYIRTLRSLREKNLDWTKTRLLFLGNKDAQSPLERLPSDLINLIFQKKSQLTFEKS